MDRPIVEMVSKHLSGVQVSHNHKIKNVLEAVLVDNVVRVLLRNTQVSVCKHEPTTVNLATSDIFRPFNREHLTEGFLQNVVYPHRNFALDIFLIV